MKPDPANAPDFPQPAPSLVRLRELRGLLPPAQGPLRSVEPLRTLCREIRLDGRLEESLQAAPLKAGPLNSDGVAVRVLQRLNALSPAYVRHLVQQLEAWAALDELSRGADQAAPTASPPAENARTARRRSAR